MRARYRGRTRGARCTPGYGYTVVVAEKPRAAQKIAAALGRPWKCNYMGVPYWILYRDGEKIIVAPSAGHLYGPYTRKRGFPVYEYEWAPLWEHEKGARHLRKFHAMLEYVMRSASFYVNACDYDIEGSVIGYLIIERLGDPRRAKRMVFSSLSPREIRRSWADLRPLDKEMVEAGMARHEMDWLWGINVSRALMYAARKITGERIILSAGRVQTPTLAEAVRRWREANLAVPTPHFTIRVEASHDGEPVTLTPHGWAPQTRPEAVEVVAGLRRRPFLVVESYEAEETTARPPPAFNLGDLQAEAARIYGYSPMKTQKLAEDLYLEALISYPRTNSQRLPPTIDYASIIRSLAGNPEYTGLATSLLQETGGILRPVQGRKDDPAHPAIHPTGERPRGLDRDHWRIYDLIVRRFLAAFARPARIRRGVLVARDAWDRPYSAKGVQVVYEGWMKYYHFLRPREAGLPPLSPGTRMRVEKASMSTKWAAAKPPLSKTSLVKWMEAVNIGTEATRARIVELLYKRGYLESRGGRTVATDLGVMVSEIVEELFPDLARVELTRKFESYIDAIRRGEASRRDVVRETIQVIDSLLQGFRERLEQAGYKLALALGYVEPENKCSICHREAVTGDPLPLCRLHAEAYKRLSSALPRIAAKLGVGEDEALRAIAGRRGEAGKWVIEVARLLSTPKG